MGSEPPADRTTDSRVTYATSKARAPLRRTIDGSDVAGAALFLLDPAGKGVTAEVLMVDAGFHAMGV